MLELVTPLGNGRAAIFYLMTKKVLGKIESVYFGLGGYQLTQMGIQFVLAGKGWGTMYFKGHWDPTTVKRTESTKWTEEERDKALLDTVKYISQLLNQAKVGSIDQLVGIPIECEFDEDRLKSFRILEEVL